MKVKKSTLLLPLFTVAGLMAQSSTSPNPSTQEPTQTQRSMKGGRHHRMQRLSARLNLTPEQQQQVGAIFRDASAQQKPLRARLHEERASLTAAIKTDSEKQIDEITRRNADALAQMQAIHAKTMAKVYSILTPDQKAKFDTVYSRHTRTKGAHGQHNG
jgi:Spy/CpxP family protein refolding chaperone